MGFESGMLVKRAFQQMQQARDFGKVLDIGAANRLFAQVVAQYETRIGAQHGLPGLCQVLLLQALRVARLPPIEYITIQEQVAHRFGPGSGHCFTESAL